MTQTRTELWNTRCVAIGCLLIGIIAACQQRGQVTASDNMVWRFAIEEIPGSVQDAYAQKFADLIARKSNGTVTVTVYPYGSLGTSDQVTELVHMGAVHFAMASPGHLGKLIPEVQLLLLHFIFSEDNTVNKAVLSDQTMLASFDALYRKKGLQILALYPEGWQVWTTTIPIRKPDDFTGLKMRVMTSPMLIEAYRAYGANPTPLPYSEVYSALQLHMIDGQVNPVFAIEEMSFYEVTKYMTFAKHAQFITSVVTNPAFFGRLSVERQRMVQETITELNEYIFTVQEDFNAARLEKIQQRKPELQMVHLSPEERDLFRKASLPVRQQYVALTGPTGALLLEQLLRSVAKAEEAVD